MVRTFTAVHGAETFSSVHRPTRLGGDPQGSHHTSVHPVPAGQDHLRSPTKAHKADSTLMKGLFVLFSVGVHNAHCDDPKAL